MVGPVGSAQRCRPNVAFLWVDRSAARSHAALETSLGGAVILGMSDRRGPSGHFGVAGSTLGQLAEKRETQFNGKGKIMAVCKVGVVAGVAVTVLSLSMGIAFAGPAYSPPAQAPAAGVSPPPPLASAPVQEPPYLGPPFPNDDTQIPYCPQLNHFPKRSIIAEIDKYFKQSVTLFGFVSNWFEEDPNTNTKEFLFEDDWRNPIRVVADRPEYPITKNVRYRIYGIVNYDSAAHEHYITMIRMCRVSPEPPPGWVPGGTGTTPIPPKKTCQACGSTDITQQFIQGRMRDVCATCGAVFPPVPPPYWVIAALVVCLVLLVVVVVLLIKMRGKASGGLSTGGLSTRKRHQVSTESGDDTIKIDYEVSEPTEQAKEDKTIKMMPGSFQVLGGDAPILIFRPAGVQDHEFEYTIGRNPGSDIHFDHLSVSRHQAKLLFRNGRYSLINLPDPASESSNATKINGEVMQREEGRELNDGDTIQMGSVTMVYHHDA